MRTGIIYASLAFLSWGLFPLYFHALNEVPAGQILAHRVLWSLAFLMVVLTVRRQWRWLPEVVKRPKVVASFIASALLLSVNWLIYIWSVNHGHVIDASLGYFINPLVNVMLGFVVLGERMRKLQWAAIAVATAGVLWLTWQAGTVPWIALALGYVVWLTMHGANVFLTTPSDATRWLLVAAGPITAIPLLMFAAGARRIPMAVLGMIQYIGPTIQFLLGVWLFQEAFTMDRLVGFALIWGALALYAAEGLWNSRK